MPDTTTHPAIERNDGRVDIAEMSYPTIIDPDEAVVYKGDQVGNFTSEYVVMSDDEEFGAWYVDNFSSLDNPNLFEKQRGLAITRNGNTEWLEYLCEIAPGHNKPLTELGDD